MQFIRWWFNDLVIGAEELAKYDVNKITTPVNMWDRLKNKWRAK